jgi:hypothetical protein
MKRFIIGPVGVFSLIATLCVAGCVAQQTDQTETQQNDQNADGVHMVGIDGNGEEQQQINTAERPVLKHSADAKKKGTESYGPLPDPWANGPLPDPWSQPPSSSSSSSSGSSGDSNGK